jgi:hypothetical protein
MNKTKVIKSVGLNTKNEEDKKILKHVSKRNFSGYVKKLILQDIMNKQEKKQQQATQVKQQTDNKESANSPLVHERPSVQNHNRKKVVQSVASPLPLLNLQNKSMKGN